MRALHGVAWVTLLALGVGLAWSAARRRAPATEQRKAPPPPRRPPVPAPAPPMPQVLAPPRSGMRGGAQWQKILPSDVLASPGSRWGDEEERLFQKAFKKAHGQTMVYHERLRILWSQIGRLQNESIRGDIVECGVWRGGASMMMAQAQLRHGSRNRMWLYDTFEGMTEPGPEDGPEVQRTYRAMSSTGQPWHKAGVDIVKENMIRSGYPQGLVSFVKGPVEETLTEPHNLPDKIALLRLDTDWYNSTKAELEILYPRLVPGGIVWIDDYCMGHIAGAKQATIDWMTKEGNSRLVNTAPGSVRLHPAQCLWWRKPPALHEHEWWLPYGVGKEEHDTAMANNPAPLTSATAPVVPTPKPTPTPISGDCAAWNCSCQDLADFYGIDHGVMWGCAGPHPHTWWIKKLCTARLRVADPPGCQTENGRILLARSRARVAKAGQQAPPAAFLRHAALPTPAAPSPPAATAPATPPPAATPPPLSAPPSTTLRHTAADAAALVGAARGAVSQETP
eukprot:TRINITY_DN835_c0_g2_i1.p1 TRINITY_DN835_c0_g2~~TRINITY_DN835_c0_g2_i1.p1  ORF type:complete len:508 (+),score=48.66 TRINITY_DN835_c0_g2_i1:86-1609(+)